jgi:uncharacterized protein DUF4177
MAIRVTCPSCGAKRSLTEEFRGRSLTCPKCGHRFTASGSTEVPFLRVEAPSTYKEAPPKAPTAPTQPLSTPAESASSPSTAKGQPDRSARKKTAEKTSGTHHRAVPSPQEKTPRREYKVLTRKNLWFAGAFNPEILEEALNSFAQQGWTLKSTTSLLVVDHQGEREELIIIMER